MSQLKYLGHIISNDLCNVPDIRREKRSMYYMSNMLYAKLRHANEDLLIPLFKPYCTHMYGCELWNVDTNQRSFREMHVTYHRCVKKLINFPIGTRNHELCHCVKLLTCPMLLAKRQLMFHRRINQSSNGIVHCIRNSVIGCNGICAKANLAIR